MIPDSVKRHAELISNPAFQTTLDFVMLQLVQNLRNGDLNTAMANAHRLEGARDFMNMLKDFHLKPELSQRTADANLKGNVN